MSFLFPEKPDLLTPGEEKWFNRAKNLAKGGVALMGAGVGLALIGLPTNDLGMAGAALSSEFVGFTTYVAGIGTMNHIGSHTIDRPQAETLPLEYSPEN